MERREMSYWGAAAIVGVSSFFGLPPLNNWLREVTGSKADEITGVQKKEAAKEAAAQALRADFEETGGVNLEKLADPPSYQVTLRESARLAPSEAEHWAQVIAMVKRESGCPSIGPILHFPEKRDPFWGPLKEPESWLVTTNCP